MRRRDPDGQIFLNRRWNNATHKPIDLDNDEWFTPIETIVNGRQDAFTQRYANLSFISHREHLEL
jgi:hypothetical protein